MPTRRRWVSIDVLKAVATLTVVWIHTAHGLARPTSVVIYLTTILSGFAVPGFFFAAGFLRWRPSPVPVAAVRGWIERLLPPYLVASLVWLIARAASTGTPIRVRSGLLALVVGNAHGIYYFVPMLAGALLLTIPLSRRPQLGVPALVLLGIAGWLCRVGIEPLHGFFWTMRDPLRWWGFFVAGWCVAAWLASVPARRHLVRTGGIAVLGAVAVLGVVAAMYLSRLAPSDWVWPPSGTLGYVVTYALILGVVGSAMDAAEHPAVRFVSAASYPVYLYHTAFVDAGRALIPLRGLIGFVPVFTFACLGSFALVAVGRAVLGRWSAVILGTAAH
jgi:peptidoglycan/LPS O-acetylase OafA/YrhL